MPADLGRHLGDDEPVRPGGEPAAPLELPQLADDGHQRIGRRRVGQAIKLWPSDPQPRAAPGYLTPCDTYQQLVQTSQGRFPAPAGPGQRPDPIRRLSIQAGRNGENLLKRMITRSDRAVSSPLLVSAERLGLTSQYRTVKMRWDRPDPAKQRWTQPRWLW
jgi:hypothetical protein